MTTLNKPIHRVTRAAFFEFGPDRGRPFVASLEPGDVLTLRPLRVRREGASITIKLCDIYRYALLCRVNCARLEKAREKKAKIDAGRKHRRLMRELRREERQAAG